MATPGCFRTSSAVHVEAKDGGFARDANLLANPPPTQHDGDRNQQHTHARNRSIDVPFQATVFWP